MNSSGSRQLKMNHLRVFLTIPLYRRTFSSALQNCDKNQGLKFNSQHPVERDKKQLRILKQQSLVAEVNFFNACTIRMTKHKEKRGGTVIQLSSYMSYFILLHQERDITKSNFLACWLRLGRKRPHVRLDCLKTRAGG